jgi:hypothetical protein
MLNDWAEMARDYSAELRELRVGADSNLSRPPLPI